MAPKTTAKSGVKSARLSAVKIHADGTREPLGEISYWHKNPLRRLWWRVTHWR